MQNIAQYMQLKHKDIIYRFDLIADFPMKPYQAMRVKRIHPKRGYPDMFIAKPSGNYAGLFLELKAEELIKVGYKANFAIGFEDAVKQIEGYLNGE